jgi:hypothetical protein
VKFVEDFGLQFMRNTEAVVSNGYLALGDTRCPLLNAKHSETSAPVVLPLSAPASKSAITVLTKLSCITLAEIGTVQDGNPRLAIGGWTELPENFCQFPTVTSLLHFRAPLTPLIRQNAKLIYNLLFRCVSETLLTIARDPSRLGAELGFLAVLHTWNQKMLAHPHLHCLVPAGGLSRD